MVATLSDFREWFPGPPFDALTDDTVTRSLNEALIFHDEREEATLYLTAHLLALDVEAGDAETRNGIAPDGGAGVVTSETIGPRTIGYLTQAGKNERRAFFATTPYGRRFLALEDRTPRYGIGAIVVS